MGTGNTGEGKVTRHRRGDIFRAFDSLPPEVRTARTALNDARGKWCPVEARQALDGGGMSADELIELIRKADNAEFPKVCP